MTLTRPHSATKAEEKARKRAEALRENLKRRKDQAQARQDLPDEACPQECDQK